MIEILPAPDHVVAFRVSGRVDEADVARAIEAVEGALARHERIALYAEVDFAGMSPGAFANDVRYGVSKLRELRRFPKAAVVTAQDWVRWAARVEGAILPQVEVRVFSPEEREAALAWASDPLPPVEQEAVPSEPSIDRIETTSPNVIAFAVNGRIRADDMRLVIAASEAAMAAHGQVRVLLRVQGFEGVGLDALRQEGLAAMKLKGLRQVERYALVGGPAWMASVASWFPPLGRAQVRHFDLDREDEAWQWLEARPKPEAT